MTASAGSLGPGTQRDPAGDAKQPAAQGAARANRAGSAGEYQEGSLESVLCVMNVAQEPPAKAEHHGAMALHEQGERPLFAEGREASEEFPIAQVAHGLRLGQGPQMSEYGL
jgi:hypothetical protein